MTDGISMSEWERRNKGNPPCPICQKPGEHRPIKHLGITKRYWCYWCGVLFGEDMRSKKERA